MPSSELIVLALAILFVASCQQASTQAATTTISRASATQQLIIKFKPGTVACDPNGIARWSSLTHVSLQLVRPMSGNACVVKQFALDMASLARGLTTLQQSPAVEYLERDAAMEKF